MTTKQNHSEIVFINEQMLSPYTFFIDGIRFSCIEQFLMYYKAQFFQDIGASIEILQLTSPQQQIKRGKTINDFNSKLWNSAVYNILAKGTRILVRHNPALKSLLQGYKDCTIVYASKDKLIGIGYEPTKGLAHIDSWGQNLFGKTLQELIKKI